MNLAMTLLVHNEIDVLETNLEFHAAQGVDTIIVMDRKSTDGSREVLRRWEKAGRIQLLLRDVDSFDQGPWVTEMARMAHEEFGADWVINNDTDEFWWPTEGTLRSTLAAIPDDVKTLLVPRQNFAPRPVAEGPFWERMTLRETASLNVAGVPLQGKVLHRGAPQVEVRHGNHGLLSEDHAEALPTDAISVFHFPMRSYEQYEYKVVSGARVLEATDLQWEVGHTWRRLYALYGEGRLREYYDNHVVQDGDVEAALSAGTHVMDRRLAVFLRARDIGRAAA